MKSIKDMFYISELSIFGVCFFFIIKFIMLTELHRSKNEEEAGKRKDKQQEQEYNNKKKQCATSFSVNIHKK